MFKKFVAAIGFACAIATAHAQGVPTYDNFGALSWTQQLMFAKQQLSSMEQQYGQLQSTYNSLNGLRNISSLLNNSLLAQYLPPDVMSTVNALKGGNLTGGISGSLTQIAQQYQSMDCKTRYVTTSEQQACQTQWQKAAMSQYIGQQGYATAGQNIQDLQQFLNQIQTGAPDAKSMQDLQARISLEQVKQQNEATKLATVKMMQDAQDRMDHMNAVSATGNNLQTGTGIRF
jgi:type IV secretion system protein VirB5